MTKLLRLPQVCGRDRPIPVGRTKFREDYLFDAKNPEEQFLPGTTIPRLRAVKIGRRAIGFLSDEVEALIEALRRERDRELAPRKRRARAN
jgi:hypothetical protein